jgi:hypothetical protein
VTNLAKITPAGDKILTNQISHGNFNSYFVKINDLEKHFSKQRMRNMICVVILKSNVPLKPQDSYWHYNPPRSHSLVGTENLKSRFSIRKYNLNFT